MNTIDHEFLKTGSKWSLTDIQNLQYSFLSSLPAYYTLNPFLGTSHALKFQPGTANALSKKPQNTDDPNTRYSKNSGTKNMINPVRVK